MRIFCGYFPPDERKAALTCGLPLVLLAAEFLRWQVPASVATELLYFLARHVTDRLELSDTFSGARTNQHAVAITIEAVACRDGVFVGGQNVLPSGKLADHREQRRAR